MDMLFGKSKKPNPEETPKARKGLDPKIKARLYTHSLMSCGTPEGALTNASSLQSLMQDHPDAPFLSEEVRLQIGQFLFDMGNRTPEKADTFFSLAEFFGYQTAKPEGKGLETKATSETAPPLTVEPAPTQPTAPADPEGYGGSIEQVVAQFQDAPLSPGGGWVIESGVEPGNEQRYAASTAAGPPAPSQPERTPRPPEQQPESEPDPGAMSRNADTTQGVDLRYTGEEADGPAETDPLRAAKEKYYGMYTDFANNVEACAGSESLSENKKALTLGLKLEKLLGVRQTALPMEDAVKLRNAFSSLRITLENRNEAAYAIEALRLAAAFGDEEAAKAQAEASRQTPAEPEQAAAPPNAQPQAVPPKKGRPYDAPIDDLWSLIGQDAVGREALEKALEPASILEAMIKAGSAVPLRALKEIAEKASELGNAFSAERKWEEAKLSYKLALVFSRDKQAAYEQAAARAEEVRTKRLFANLAKGDGPFKPPSGDITPQESRPTAPDETEGGPKIMQGSAEAYQYLLQTSPGIETLAPLRGDIGKGKKPEYSDKYLMDPIHAYAVLASKDVPSAETVLRIIELHKTSDKYTADLAVKHAVMQTPEMQAKIEKLFRN